nr:DegT/DnrJ/EryC1/StrS family aminotransferase [Acinetobacter sp. Marseille-Q1620]
MKPEIPPTNGLALYFKDLNPFNHQQDLASCISTLLNIPKPALTCSGTAALIIALETLKELYPQKTQVIIPAWTCPLVALAIEKIGLIPILCDLEKNHFKFDLHDLKQKNNTSTLAIIVTHFAGLVYDLTDLKYIAQQHNTYLIEDAAQAMGAKYNHQSIGLQGDIAFFSLAFGKGLTSAEGGILFSICPELQKKLHKKASKVPMLKDWEFKRSIELLGYTLLYRPSTLSWIYGHHLRKYLKENNEIAAVGDDFNQEDIPIHQLGKWRSHVAAHAANRLPEHWNQAHLQAKKRIEQLRKLPHLTIFDEESSTTATFPFILILAEHKKITDAILAALWTGGLGITKLFVRAIPDYPALKHLHSSVPNAIDFAERSFTITNSAWLDDQNFNKILKTIEMITLQYDLI